MTYRNKKTGNKYEVVDDMKIINATNEQDGQEMIIYVNPTDPDTAYVREKKEFFEKFEEVAR